MQESRPLDPLPLSAMSDLLAFPPADSCHVLSGVASAAVAAQSADGELAPDSRREKVNTTEADRYIQRL